MKKLLLSIYVRIVWIIIVFVCVYMLINFRIDSKLAKKLEVLLVFVSAAASTQTYSHLTTNSSKHID